MAYRPSASSFSSTAFIVASAFFSVAPSTENTPAAIDPPKLRPTALALPINRKKDD